MEKFDPRNSVNIERNRKVVAVASSCFVTSTVSLPTETITLAEYDHYGGVPVVTNGKPTENDQALAFRPGEPMKRFQDAPKSYPKMFAAALEISME